MSRSLHYLDAGQVRIKSFIWSKEGLRSVSWDPASKIMALRTLASWYSHLYGLLPHEVGLTCVTYRTLGKWLALLPRRSHKGKWCFYHAFLDHHRGSQPPCHEETQAALWRGPHSGEVMPHPSKSPNLPSMWGIMLEPILQPQPSLQKTTVTVEILISPSHENPNRDCSGK